MCLSSSFTRKSQNKKNTQHLKYKTGSIQTKIQFCCGVCLCVCKRERKNNWKNCEILCMSISHATYLIMRVRECNTNPWEPEADSQRLRRATLYTDPRSAEDLKTPRRKPWVHPSRGKREDLVEDSVECQTTRGSRQPTAAEASLPSIS